MSTRPDASRLDRLTDPELYRAPFAGCPGGEDILRRPVTDGALTATDEDVYRYYVDHSCDLTMRGGTTSGVVYPLAVCTLAQHYVFRSVGGASAGAIAASATAAAELGRLAPAPARQGGSAPPPGRDATVRPGFAGLAEIIQWLAGPRDARDEQWRLAQLFQPGAIGRPIFRVLAAQMQSARTTGRSKARCLAVALMTWGTPSRLVAAAVLLGVWWLGPAVSVVLVPPWQWAAFPLWTQWTVTGLAVAMLCLAGWALRRAARIWRGIRQVARETRARDIAGALRTRITAALLGVAPLLPVLVAGLVRGLAVEDPATRVREWPGAAVSATAATAVLWWLALTLAVVMAFAIMYGVALAGLVERQGQRIRFGLVPGAEPTGHGATGTGERIRRWVDRCAGMPASTGVPPLSTWLADRIDDLAGTPPAEAGQPRRALTFGDLWLGRRDRREGDEQRLRVAAHSARERVINLELMATNLSQGRPYRLPFASFEQTAEVGGPRWLFCPDCLAPALPARVVRQLTAASTKQPDVRCPDHPGVALHRLPEPWDMPIVMAARMSLALPGLIGAVPLYTQASGAGGPLTPQWFSDGGITSNFPIHFFDSLLPRWPTFGLTLQAYPAGEPAEDVWLPPQDDSATSEPWEPIRSGSEFAGAVRDTALGWRDTMQSALPGFRGRIAHVRRRSEEGGTNLFMTRGTILCLALRGLDAGEALKARFTGDDGRPDQTQTDRYRWIRMRLALRKYCELADEAASRRGLYGRLARRFAVPRELARWFGPESPVSPDSPVNPAPVAASTGAVAADPVAADPAVDPEAPRAEAAVEALACLVAPDRPLRGPFTGTPPVNPNLRLTPPE